MIKFIKNLFSPAQPHERMIPIEEKEYIYMGDGMMEEVIRRGDPAPKATAGSSAAALSKARNQNPNRTGTAPTATHYDRSYTDNTHMSMVAPAAVIYSTPSYTPSTGGYDPGYSSCDSGFGGGSCD